MDDFEGIKTSVKDVTAYVAEEQKDERSGAWKCAALLQSHDKTLRDEEFLLMNQQRMCFFEMETAPGEDAVKIVEMITKHLEFYINLVDTIAPVF